MTRAVLFDFGGTLYDYATLAPGDAESILALARWAGLAAELPEIRRAQREAMRAVFRDYLPRRYYLHRDLFRDAAAGTMRGLGVEPDAEHLDRFRDLQWALHKRDFQLRPGVVDTLQALRARGLHIGMVSNIDDDQLAHLLDVAGLRPYFDSLLSSETAGACKPHARSSRKPCAARLRAGRGPVRRRYAGAGHRRRQRHGCGRSDLAPRRQAAGPRRRPPDPRDPADSRAALTLLYLQIKPRIHGFTDWILTPSVKSV
jgi:FMN phosphatase YigB (HAD superfamily)